MKKLLLVSCIAWAAAGCNNSGETNAAKADSTGTAVLVQPAVPEMPYTLDEPYKNWQTGDPQNALTVMKSLKGYETGDIAACVAGFGDSVVLHFDKFRAKLSNDSLKSMFTEDRMKNVASMKIQMNDWESVISEDKKEQWVTLWYKQIWTDKKGKTDSISCVDDAKIENGKIVLLDEKVQHYPDAKK